MSYDEASFPNEDPNWNAGPKRFRLQDKNEYSIMAVLDTKSVEELKDLETKREAFLDRAVKLRDRSAESVRKTEQQLKKIREEIKARSMYEEPPSHIQVVSFTKWYGGVTYYHYAAAAYQPHGSTGTRYWAVTGKTSRSKLTWEELCKFVLERETGRPEILWQITTGSSI